ncbi:MAG: 50S ribosomal protein L21e [Nanoarchaeota archaeon]
MKRIGGSRRKTRKKLKKNIRLKGKISLRKYFQNFNIGDKVCLVAEPSIQKSMYHARFHSLTGTVKAKRGSCYEILVKDKNKEKTIITHPIHLKRL